MADNGAPNPQFLAPPAVTALRQEARALEPVGPAMTRSFSEDMREERQQLKEAAEQTLNVIVDLDLDGRVKWVSPSWKQVVGTPPESIEGHMISDILVGNKTVFQDAIELMKTDDSRSRFIRFAVPMGANSVLKFSPEPRPPPSPEGETEDEHQVAGDSIEAHPVPDKAGYGHDVLIMEAQGIMVYDRFAPDKAGHTMWMLRPFTQAREVTIDLPPLLVESLGVGAEVLANYLTELADAAGKEPDPSKHPVPTPVLCRICERQILPWWFEKHSDLCLQEHQAEMDVQIAQENLNEHRHAIVRILDALEARQGRSVGDTGMSASPQPEYKGLPIGPSPTASSGPSSGIASSSSSSPGTPSRSREQSVSGGAGHARARSFAVRRPLARIVELILDLCDTALEISTPALKESRTEAGEEFRTLSPQSESRITQVLQWQSPSSNTLEQEQGLAALAADTEEVAKAKVDAVVRHRKILEYAERIRVEYTVLVEECIAAALSKAERIAAGQLSDSSSCSSAEDDEVADSSSSMTRIPSREPSVAPAISALTASMRESTDRLLSQSEGRSSSVAVSTGSNSPMECPTPRSHKSAAGLLSTSQPSRRGTLLADLDAGETSDSSSVPSSSILPGAIRTDSPSSERSLERKRRSLVLPGLCVSPRRQQSPARIPPHSPLRMPKPRLSSGAESMPSPIASPSTTTSEFALHHHVRHHRRQSSASDVPRPPVSPRLTSVSQPQPRPAPPSIKDFEIIKPISKGAFGSVYLSKKKSTGEYFAIKVLKKADMIAKNQVTNVKAERAIMMWQGESDFVAKLYWTFSSKEYLYLVMEYLNGGDCASLVKVLGGLSEDWAKKYVAEVVLGVEHLHSRGIVHRDLKPDNLLIDQSGHLKLTDFGLSRMGLVGRQKRVLKSPNEQVPDLLKQGPFPRARSLASSRSASFDLQGSYSPGSTPLITPDVPGGVSQPSYFSLNQSALSRQSSRRASGYRSDSGGSDTLNAIFRTFSLNEGSETPAPLPLATNAAEEEGQSELSDSPQLQPIQQASSYPTSSVLSQLGTPPQQTMVPPLMALFDPEDQNRRFVGTPDYLAPETINGVGQDEMSDWWSLGCIMFEFLFGYPPFNAPTPDEVFDNILHRRINWPDEPESLVSPEALDLMNKLMTINPRERLGANVDEKFPNGGAEIRAHPWFSDINWDTLLEDKAEFVPNVENPEDTEYFDNRGATLQTFTEELEDQISPPHPVTTGPYPDRPHDALFKVRSQVNAIKRPLMPLHIPPHVRDSRSRRLSEPVLADDFGNFTFKNLPMLEKANKDVIQKLRQEALQAQQRQSTSVAQTPVSTSSPSLDGSPLPMPLQRTMSQTKGNNRPSSPSAFSQANSSPSRPSQPSSPLLVQFSTGQNHERRKTSGSSSTNSHQSSGSFQPAAADPGAGRVTNLKLASAAASPGKAGGRITTHSPEKTASGQPKVPLPPARARSQTIGSQDGETGKEPYASGHHKRRSQLFDVSPSSSDNEDPRTKALLKVQRRRQSSRRLSQINMLEGPFFRPLDVLICEDHPVSRLVMERLFEKLRCRTITAVNGAEAMRYALSEIQFDIIMTEFKLPQVNGADFARMVREARSANRHTPIVAVTGYLKDLPETHHFDALIEKPPTLSKLTEALCKFCQWKPPPKDYSPSQPPPLTAPASALRNVPGCAEDSPSSTSSGFVHMLASSYRGSSRADSIASSYFGDMDQIKPEDVPFIISRHNEDWTGNHGGLGISEDPTAAGQGHGQQATTNEPKDTASSGSVPFPHLLHAASAPAAVEGTGALTPRKQRSSEAIRAKRESLEKKRYECAESGDDEDDELGNANTRTRSPATRAQRPGSKLGIEMMRTNSRGSVVSGSEEILKKEAAAAAAMERGRTGSGGDNADDDDEGLLSSGSTGLEDKFDLLRIPEDDVLGSSQEADISPRHSLSPLPEDQASNSRSLPTTEARRPSLSQYETEIYTGPGPSKVTAGAGLHKSRSELQSRGEISPPIVLTTDDGDDDDDGLKAAAAAPTEPQPKTPHNVLSLGATLSASTGSDPALRSDGDVSPTPDSEATPRPLHTPSPRHDPEETPRAQPSKRPATAQR